MAKNEQAQQIDPRSLAISRNNRQFNALHVHNVILKSIARDGHDPTRPHVGICVEVTDPAQLKDLVEYNEELTNNSDLMPPLHKSLVQFECLDSTHYNVALRLGKANAPSSAGDLAAMKRTDESFNIACERGHWWIILPGTIPQSLKADVCTWRNQDQNENQPITDGEIVRLAAETVTAFQTARAGVVTTQMPLSEIVKGTCLRTPLKINPISGWGLRPVCLPNGSGRQNEPGFGVPGLLDLLCGLLRAGNAPHLL